MEPQTVSTAKVYIYIYIYTHLFIYIHIYVTRDASYEIRTPGFHIKELHIKKLRGWTSVKKHNFLTRGGGWKNTSQKDMFLFVFRTIVSEAPRRPLLIRICCLNRYCFERPLRKHSPEVVSYHLLGTL